MTNPKSKKIATISTAFIDNICERLIQGKRVRRTLPMNGRLHIDRQLPFLCVYRRPSKRPDKGTDRLVKGEASYLIASDDGKLKTSLSALVHGIAKTLSSECRAFLIIEIWTAREGLQENEHEIPVSRPAFRIVTSQTRIPTATIEALETALERIKILKQKASVELIYKKKQWPEHLPPLLSSADAKSLNCFKIGLEVEPVFRDPDSGEVYPLVLRRLHSGLARALKRSVFEFSLHQTSHHPRNYQALGRRAVVKAVWEVDHRLAEISNAFDFLLQVTPVNIDQAWHEFKRHRFERHPVFIYRPSPVDPALLKRTLFEIAIERIEDPSLAFLFREKRIELEQQLSMLRDRGTHDFLYGSLQLYGSISESLAKLATDILHKIAQHSHESSGASLKADEFAARARQEIEFYRATYPEMSSQVQIRDDTTGLMVSRGSLLIGRQIRVPESRVEALLQHELGTHALTYFNGRFQPFQQLYTGLAGYDELQEGLAVLSEHLVGGLSRPRLRLLAGRVIAAKNMVSGAAFVDTFRELNRVHGFEQRTSYSIAARIYRGGGLTKDAVYLRGLVSVLKYIKDGGELEPLLVGKIAASHIPIIKELQARRVLKPIPLRPRYLDNPKTQERLARLRNGVSVLNLIERRDR